MPLILGWVGGFITSATVNATANLPAVKTQCITGMGKVKRKQKPEDEGVLPQALATIRVWYQTETSNIVLPFLAYWRIFPATASLSRAMAMMNVDHVVLLLLLLGIKILVTANSVFVRIFFQSEDQTHRASEV